ncbi:MAG: MFS transporter [Candidatus Parcubacteria bacterium]|nr:MFS transporter [Candidatus Parcubacteria bacterium]
MPNNNIKMKINSLYLGIFILAVSEAIIAYVQSTYLNQFFNLNWVSLVFIITYVVTFFVINEYSNFIARFNNFRTAIAALVVKLLSLLIFIFCANPTLVFIGFVLFTVSFNLIFINFDIFLEAFSANVKTGRIRGTYFTIYNLGWLVSPFMAGQILEKFGFKFLFRLDLVLTVLVVLVLLYSFRQFTNHYQSRHFSMVKTLREILRRKNIKKIFYCAFILNFFYAVMLIYTPIHLNQYIGLAWGDIGLVFTIMLLPFVLLQYPAGYLADKYWGEKEILTAGLIIMALASAAIFFVNTTSLLIWGIILLISRIGASLVEIMRESYFFKKVDVEDIELINALRSTVPLSYILAPMIVGLLLYFLSLNYIFLILGIIVLTGLYPALTLKDTK